MDESTLPAPLAPFADRGTGGYTREGQLKKDIGIARRMINEPLWPVSKELRAEVIEWLELVMKLSDDDRSRVAAAKGILSADKLNIEFTKLEIQEHLGNEKQPDQPSVTAVQVNVNVDGSSKSETTVFERLKALEKTYASIQSASAGTVAGDGAGK